MFSSAGGRLVVLDRSGRVVKTYPLPEGLATIGSDLACDLRIMLPAVSPHHATIVVHANQTVVRSVSEGETLVNGVPVSVAALRHNDVISVGGRLLRWEYPDTTRKGSLAMEPISERRAASAAAAGGGGGGRGRRRVSVPLKPLLLKTHSHRASMPASMKQVAIVQPQRRDAATDNVEEPVSGRSPNTSNPRRSGINVQANHDADTSHRKSSRSAQPTTKAAQWMESRVRARSSGPRRRARSLTSALAPHATKINPPVAIDQTKRAAIMLMTRHTKSTSPDTRHGPTLLMKRPSPVKRITPIKSSPKKTPRKTPKTRKTPKRVTTDSTRSINNIEETNASIVEISDVEASVGRSMTRRSGIISLKSPKLASPKKSALKDPAKRLMRKTESIKFDLSNLGQDRRDSLDTVSDITLRYSDASDSPSPTRSLQTRSSIILQKSIGSPISVRSRQSDDQTQESINSRQLEVSQSKSPSRRSRVSTIVERALSTSRRSRMSKTRTPTHLESYSVVDLITEDSVGSPSVYDSIGSPTVGTPQTSNRTTRSFYTLTSSTPYSADVAPSDKRESCMITPENTDVLPCASTRVSRASRTRSRLNDSELLVDDDESPRSSKRSRSVPSPAKRSVSSSANASATSIPSRGSPRAVSQNLQITFNRDSPRNESLSRTSNRYSPSILATANLSLPRASSRGSIGYVSQSSVKVAVRGSPQTASRSPSSPASRTSPRSVSQNSSRSGNPRSPSTANRNMSRSANQSLLLTACRDSPRTVSRGSLVSVNQTSTIISNRDSPKIVSRSSIRNSHQDSPRTVSKNSYKAHRDSPIIAVQSASSPVSGTPSSNKQNSPTNMSINVSNDGITTPDLVPNNKEVYTPVLNIQSLLDSSQNLSTYKSKKSLKKKSIGVIGRHKKVRSSKSLRKSGDVTPTSAVMLTHEAVKNKHSTAKKPTSKRSLIDDLNESDLVKQLFNSPVKRNLSRSIKEFSKLEDDLPRKRTRANIALVGTPDNSISLCTEAFTPELFVSPLNTPSHSPNLDSVQRLLQDAQKEANVESSRISRSSRQKNTDSVYGIKTLFGRSPNRLSDVRVKELFAKSPKNDLRLVSAVKSLFLPSNKKSPENNLDDVRGVKKLFAKSPRNDLRNVSGLKSTFRRTPKNDLRDVRGVKRLLRQDRIVSSELSGVELLFHETEMSAFDQLVGRPAVRAYPGTAQKTGKKTKLRQTKSLHDSIDSITNNVEDWLDTELKRRLNKSADKTNVTRELQKLSTDTVDGKTPMRLSRTRNDTATYSNHTLPIKKRSLVDKSNEGRALLPLKKRVIVHSTPMKGRHMTMNASELGRVSPIAISENIAQDNNAGSSRDKDTPILMKTKTPSPKATAKKSKSKLKKTSPNKLTRILQIQFIENINVVPEVKTRKSVGTQYTPKEIRGKSKRNAKTDQITKSPPKVKTNKLTNTKRKRASIVIIKKMPVISPLRTRRRADPVPKNKVSNTAKTQDEGKNENEIPVGTRSVRNKRGTTAKVPVTKSKVIQKRNVKFEVEDEISAEIESQKTVPPKAKRGRKAPNEEVVETKTKQTRSARNQPVLDDNQQATQPKTRRGKKIDPPPVPQKSHAKKQTISDNSETNKRIETIEKQKPKRGNVIEKLDAPEVPKRGKKVVVTEQVETKRNRKQTENVQSKKDKSKGQVSEEEIEASRPVGRQLRNMTMPEARVNKTRVVKSASADAAPQQTDRQTGRRARSDKDAAADNKVTATTASRKRKVTTEPELENKQTTRGNKKPRASSTPPASPETRTTRATRGAKGTSNAQKTRGASGTRGGAAVSAKGTTRTRQNIVQETQQTTGRTRRR